MSKSANLHQGHRTRVRERIISEGLKSFQPHEVLEFLLFHTVPQKDTNPIAHELINTFGSFEGVLNASANDLIERGMVSENTAVFLSSLTEVFSYYEKCNKEKTVYDSLEKMINLTKAYFIGQTTEKLVIVFFDSGLRMRGITDFKTGQENSFNFNTKEILKKAVALDAYAVIMAHNHPTAGSSPSRNDIATTDELRLQLEHLDIKLLDHIIFGENSEPFSFAASPRLCGYVSQE